MPPTRWRGGCSSSPTVRAAVASFGAAVVTEIYLCDVCSCHEILRRNGRRQVGRVLTAIRLCLLRALAHGEEATERGGVRPGSEGRPEARLHAFDNGDPGKSRAQLEQGRALTLEQVRVSQ